MDKKDLDKEEMSIYNCVYLESEEILVKEIRWSRFKSIQLKLRRSVSFEEIVRAKFLGFHNHPKRSNQRILAYEYKDYVWAVPFVFNKKAFLKTLYPSRKLMKLYKKGKL
ncbi:MAG: hypothetical protein ACYDEX_22460 [Mobilitalea sp.]